jgi:hypothetical protein
MKNVLILLAVAIPALAQQNFDFKSLDKIGANAKESSNINLDGDTLKMASNFLGDKGNASLKPVMDGLKGIYVREWKFEKPGQYDPADLEPLRAYLNNAKWNKIVDVKDAKETSAIYVQPMPNDQLGGLAIISAEAKEVSVVFISGLMKTSDIGKLGGNLGIPDIRLDHAGKKSDK